MAARSYRRLAVVHRCRSSPVVSTTATPIFEDRGGWSWCNHAVEELQVRFVDCEKALRAMIQVSGVWSRLWGEVVFWVGFLWWRWMPNEVLLVVLEGTGRSDFTPIARRLLTPNGVTCAIAGQIF